jgi:hypothetical protein
MPDDLKEILEVEIAFADFAKEAIAASATVVRKHHPEKRLKFYDCGNCRLLHVTIDDGEGVMLDVAPEMWEHMKRQ